MKKINLLFTLVFFVFQMAQGQSSGICAGKIVEKINDTVNETAYEKNVESAVVFLFLKDSLKASKMTNDEGVFEFDHLQEGEYTIKIELEGFETQEIKNVKVWSGKVTLVRRTFLKRITKADQK